MRGFVLCCGHRDCIELLGSQLTLISSHAVSVSWNFNIYVLILVLCDISSSLLRWLLKLPSFLFYLFQRMAPAFVWVAPSWHPVSSFIPSCPNTSTKSFYYFGSSWKPPSVYTFPTMWGSHHLRGFGSILPLVLTSSIIAVWEISKRQTHHIVLVLFFSIFLEKYLSYKLLRHSDRERQRQKKIFHSPIHSPTDHVGRVGPGWKPKSLGHLSLISKGY